MQYYDEDLSYFGFLTLVHAEYYLNMMAALGWF